MRVLSQYSNVEFAALAADVRAERNRRNARVHECLNCGTSFPARADARYCSGRCRTAAHRKRSKESDDDH